MTAEQRGAWKLEIQARIGKQSHGDAAPAPPSVLEHVVETETGASLVEDGESALGSN